MVDKKYRGPEYNTWSSMIQRCNNKRNNNYENYGGRGITVCEDWLIFKNFYKDMGERGLGLTLDRIDNDKGYYKENCRWASKSEQQSNRKIKSATGIKGVYFNSCKNYVAQINKKGKRIYIGTFKCPLMASVSFQIKYDEVYGGMH
jgi:hypothetical protein